MGGREAYASQVINDTGRLSEAPDVLAGALGQVPDENSASLATSLKMKTPELPSRCLLLAYLHMPPLLGLHTYGAYFLN